jgi:hypothetical protein
MANVRIPPIEVEGSTVKERAVKGAGISDNVASRPRVRTESIAAASSSSGSSSQPGPSRRLSMRRPDGTSGEAGPADLESLEKVLRRESIVDVIDMAHLTLPSTPLRDNVGGASNDIKLNLELASEKLSKLAPTE